MFKKPATILAVAIALALPLTGAFASGNKGLSQEVSAQIRAKLTEQGYEVRKIEMEDGLYEAYVIKDGVRQELYLNSQLDILDRKSDD